MSNNHIYLAAFRDRRTIIPSEMAIHEIIQGVYCGFDSRTGEPLYVGLSENIRNRIYQHIQQLNRRSKAKAHWDEDFKIDPSLVKWKLLEIVENREQLNTRERYWWEFLERPRLNITDVHSKAFRTGGNTRKRHPGIQELFKMRDAGMTAPEMADALGVTKSCVYGWFRDAKQPLTKFAETKIANGLRKRTEDFLAVDGNIEMLKSEIESGLGFNSVSIKYNLERSVVKQKLEAYGCVSKYARITDDQLFEVFPREGILRILVENRPYATELSALLGTSHAKAMLLVDHYKLNHLLSVRHRRT